MTFGAAFGLLVKEYRGRKSWNQATLGLEVFKDRSTDDGDKLKQDVSKLERGNIANPHQRIVQAYCDALDIPPEAVAQLRAQMSVSEKLDNVGSLPRDQLELLAGRFDIVGTADMGDAQIQEQLTAKAREYRALKVALADLQQKLPQLGNVIAEALAQLDLGNTKEVREIIADARQTLRDGALQRSLEQDADLVEVDARALILMGDVAQAYDILNAAADSFRSLDPLEPSRRRARYYEPLYDHGLAFGGAGSGLALDMLQSALGEIDRKVAPELWATVQNNLGNSLRTLGQREAGTEHLNGAVTAYENALLELTRQAVPLHWAATQNNLGNALQALGKREAGTDRLNAAVTAYENALLERARQAVPLQWAKTQGNLANLALAFFAKSGDAAHLDRAGAYLELAREVFNDAGASQYLAMADRISAEIEKRRGDMAGGGA